MCAAGGVPHADAQREGIDPSDAAVEDGGRDGGPDVRIAPVRGERPRQRERRQGLLLWRGNQRGLLGRLLVNDWRRRRRRRRLAGRELVEELACLVAREVAGQQDRLALNGRWFTLRVDLALQHLTARVQHTNRKGARRVDVADGDRCAGRYRSAGARDRSVQIGGEARCDRVVIDDRPRVGLDIERVGRSPALGRPARGLSARRRARRARRSGEHQREEPRPRSQGSAPYLELASVGDLRRDRPSLAIERRLPARGADRLRACLAEAS